MHSVYIADRINLSNCDSSTFAKPSQTAVRIKKPIPNIELDYIRQSDLQIVAEIERQSFSDPWSLSTLQEAIDGKNPHSYFHVARLSQVPVAYVNYWLILDEAHIVNFAVSPAYRRTGLGKYLLAKSLERIRDLGGRLVHLEVRLSNIPAQNLYRQLGFRLVHVHKRYYRDNNEDACIFQMEDLLDFDFEIR